MSSIIDHIVLLVSTADFENPPPWLSNNFTILDGGNHKGQASRNKLIVFRDGTYLELFNWYDTPPDDSAQDKPMKAWAKKKPGLIDFALSSLPVTPSAAESYIGALSTRLARHGEASRGDGGLGVTYGSPVPGGRTRKDGVAVKWKVSRPEFSTGPNTPDGSVFFADGARLDAPFFCHDVTGRDIRVPYDDETKTTHPCGATGIAGVEVLVPQGRVDAYLQLYENILGADHSGMSVMQKGGVPDNEGNFKGAVFSLQVGLPSGQGGQRSAEILLGSTRSERQVTWLRERGVGISGLRLRISGRAGHGEQCLGFEGIPRTMKLVW